MPTISALADLSSAIGSDLIVLSGSRQVFTAFGVEELYPVRFESQPDALSRGGAACGVETRHHGNAVRSYRGTLDVLRQARQSPGFTLDLEVHVELGA